MCEFWGGQKMMGISNFQRHFKKQQLFFVHLSGVNLAVPAVLLLHSGGISSQKKIRLCDNMTTATIINAVRRFLKYCFFYLANQRPRLVGSLPDPVPTPPRPNPPSRIPKVPSNPSNPPKTMIWKEKRSAPHSVRSRRHGR